MTRQITLLLSCIILLLSCRKEEEIVHSTDTNVTEGEQSESIKGFFLLNECWWRHFVD